MGHFVCLISMLTLQEILQNVKKKIVRNMLKSVTHCQKKNVKRNGNRRIYLHQNVDCHLRSLTRS
jgi:hypothetical protein